LIGYGVHTPDLFDGRRFDAIDAGMGYAQRLGFPEQVPERGRRAGERLPHDVVYAVFSLGVLPVQMLAQTRPGTRGEHSARPRRSGSRGMRCWSRRPAVTRTAAGCSDA